MDGQEVQQMMEVDTPTWVFTSFLFPLCLRSDDSRDGVGRNFYICCHLCGLTILVDHFAAICKVG